MSSYFKDLVERTLATFAFTFLATFSVADLSTARDAAIAGGAAALTLIKSWLGSFVGNDEHAGLTGSEDNVRHI